MAETSTIFEPGFAAVEEATFTAQIVAKQLRAMAKELASMKGAGELALTMRYDGGANPGDLVPEIVIRVRKFGFGEADDDFDGEEDYDGLDDEEEDIL